MSRVETPRQPSQTQPSLLASEAADTRQLQLAREQGKAYLKALTEMIRAEGPDAEKQAGDFVVAYAVAAAEGMYTMRSGELEWQDPKSENAHIAIVVRDAADQRFVPGLSVYVTLLDSSGREIGKYVQAFVWHPWLYHYGRNWKVPHSGVYTLRVHIDAPDFMRHDKLNGRRFEHTVEIEFENVKIRTGRNKLAVKGT